MAPALESSCVGGRQSLNRRLTGGKISVVDAESEMCHFSGEDGSLEAMSTPSRVKSVSIGLLSLVLVGAAVFTLGYSTRETYVGNVSILPASDTPSEIGESPRTLARAFVDFGKGANLARRTWKEMKKGAKLAKAFTNGNLSSQDMKSLPAMGSAAWDACVTAVPPQDIERLWKSLSEQLAAEITRALETDCGFSAGENGDLSYDDSRRRLASDPGNVTISDEKFNGQNGKCKALICAAKHYQCTSTTGDSANDDEDHLKVCHRCGFGNGGTECFESNEKYCESSSQQ